MKFEAFVLVRAFVESEWAMHAERDALAGVGTAGTDSPTVAVIDSKVIHMRPLPDDAVPEDLV
jgi:hypothetical protein